MQATRQYQNYNTESLPASNQLQKSSQYNASTTQSDTTSETMAQTTNYIADSHTYAENYETNTLNFKIKHGTN